MSPDATAPGYDGDEDEWVDCPAGCEDGVDSDGYRCPVCGGLGQIPADEEDGDGRSEPRRDFTDREKAQLGKQGKAVYIDGHWAYPTPTRTDYDNAVTALARTPGRNRQAVRKYLIKRAKQEGCPIPESWNSDGTTKATRRSVALPPSRLDEFELTLMAMQAGSRLTRANRVPSARDTQEETWRRARESRERVSDYLAARWTPQGQP